MSGEGGVRGDGKAVRPDRDDALRSARRRRRSRPPSRADEGAAPTRSISRFDRHEARNELQAATFRAGPSRVRLLLVAERRARDRDAAAGGRAGRAGRGRGGAAARPARRFPPSPQDQRPRLLRRGARGRGHVRGAVPRSGGLPDRRQLHQPVRRARRHAGHAAARARAAPRRVARPADRGGPGRGRRSRRGRPRRRLPDRQCGARARSRAVKVGRAHEAAP